MSLTKVLSTMVSFAPVSGITSTTVQGAIPESASNLAATLAAPAGSSLVGYLPAGTGAVATTVQTKLRESVSVKDFGAVGNYIVNGSINPAPTDNLSAFQAAFAASNRITVPSGYYYLSASLTLPRYAEMIADDLEATHLISASAISVISLPIGNDGVTVYGIRFDSTTKCSGVFFGNPSGTDFSTNNRFENCVFGNSLSYTFIDKAQLATFTNCSINAPIYQIDGNYLTVKDCYFVWSSVSTAVSTIAGINFGVAGTGYFNIAGIRIDSGQGQLIDNTWFEHMPSCAIYMGAAVTGFSITNNKFERVSNGPASQSAIGLGWYIQVPDGSNILEGGIVSGNTVIGNVGTYSNGVAFTPDCLGFFGGSGAEKCSFFGNSIGFFETAKATVAGYKVSQSKPYFSDAYAIAVYANSGAYSVLPAPANGKIGAVKYLASTQQSIPNTTWTKVEAVTLVFDTDSWYITAGAASQYRPEVAGYYRVTAFVRLNAVPDGTSVGLALYKNGVSVDTLDYQSAGATTNMAVSGSTSFYSTATTGSLDLYTIYVYQNSGGSLNTIAVSDAVRLEYELIGY